MDSQLLFSGTLWSNLDPFDQFNDAKLRDALKRSYLVEELKTQGTAEDGDMMVRRDSPLIPLSRTKATICLLVNGLWSHWPGLQW